MDSQVFGLQGPQLTEESDFDEVADAGVVDHDPVGCGGAELEPDVAGILGLEGRKLESGVGLAERYDVVK